MNQKQLKNIAHNYYRKLKKHTTTIVKDFDMEAIHQYRVEYKKLRAFLRMISKQHKMAFEIKVTKKLKQGYHLLGSIRDLQLQQQRILEVKKEAFKKPHAYIILLKTEIQRLQLKLFKIFLRKTVTASKIKTDLSIPNKFKLSSFINFAEKKWAAIYAIIASLNFSDNNIHEIRKILKDLFYTLKIYKGTRYKLLSAYIWKGKNEQYFNNLLDQLGSYQDKCTAIALLKFNWLNSLNSYNRKQLEQIKRGWIKDKLRMKKLVIKKLKAEAV